MSLDLPESFSVQSEDNDSQNIPQQDGPVWFDDATGLNRVGVFLGNIYSFTPETIDTIAKSVGGSVTKTMGLTDRLSAEFYSCAFEANPTSLIETEKIVLNLDQGFLVEFVNDDLTRPGFEKLIFKTSNLVDTNNDLLRIPDSFLTVELTKKENDFDTIRIIKTPQFKHIQEEDFTTTFNTDLFNIGMQEMTSESLETILDDVSLEEWYKKLNSNK